MKPGASTILSAVAFTILIPASSFASPKYVLDIKTAYPVAPASLQTCALCHTASPPALNPFGSDFALHHQATSAGALTAIQSLDSDGDSFNNLTEINAGSMPGDPAATPVIQTDNTNGTVTFSAGNGVTVTVPGSTATSGITINNNYNYSGGATAPSAGNTNAGTAPQTSNTSACATCHSDGRSGPLPAGHMDISAFTQGSATATSGTAYPAALCITCHSDRRTGPLPTGHPNVGNLASILASNPGRSATDNSAICNTCHSGRSGTIPGDHPSLTGSLTGGDEGGGGDSGGDDHEGGDD